jgi:hypothetical protein
MANQQIAVEAEDLVPGEIYTLEAFDVSTLQGAVRETVQDLIARPHEFMEKGPIGLGGAIYMLFAPNPEDDFVEHKRIVSRWLPGRERHRFFTSATARLEKTVNKKTREYTILKGLRNRLGGLSRNIGNSVVRNAGIRTQPRIIEGGKRRPSTTRKSKKSRGRKQTRKA